MGTTASANLVADLIQLLIRQLQINLCMQLMITHFRSTQLSIFAVVSQNVALYDYTGYYY